MNLSNEPTSGHGGKPLLIVSQRFRELLEPLRLRHLRFDPVRVL